MNAVALLLTLSLFAPESSPAPLPTETETETETVEARTAFIKDARGHRYRSEPETLPEEQWNEVEADRLFEEGRTAYGEGRYRDAIELFELSYRVGPSDGTIYSMGQAHAEVYEADADQAHYQLAVMRYDAYLVLAGAGGYFATAASANLSRLSALRASEVPPTRLIVSSAVEAAWMRVDRRPQTQVGAIDIDPGHHSILVGAPGHIAQERSLEVEEGQRLALSFELDMLPGRLSIRGPTNARIEIDGQSYPQLPLESVEVSAGPHFVAVTKRGRLPYAQSVVLHPEETIELDATTRTSTQRVLALSLLGVGGCGVAVGALTVGLAISRQGRAQELNEKRGESVLSTEEYDRYEDLVQQRDRLRTTAIVTGAAGGALLITGVLLTFVERTRVDSPTLDRQTLSSRRSARQVNVAPVISSQYAGGTAKVAF